MNALTPGADARDPYTVLGVHPDTPFNDVKVVYRRLVRELHPDVNPDDPSARERFAAVQEAFEILRAKNAESKIRETESITGTAGIGGSAPRGVTAAWPATPEGTSGLGDDYAAPIQPQNQPASRQARSQTAPMPAPNQPHPRQPWEHTAPLQDRAPTAPLRATGPVTPVQAPDAAAQRVSSDRMGSTVTMRGPAQIVEGAPALNVNVIPGRNRLLLQPRAQMLYVLLDLKLNEHVGTTTQPLNLALVLDHSSSMQRDDKLQRLKQAVSRIIDMMDARDYLSIVTFGDKATVLLQSAPLGNKRAAKEALDGIRCRGGTEISTGIRTGLDELQAHSSNLISQMIMLTDGQTYGDEDICLALATQAGERQVQITALGLGDDWNSTLLDELATRTGGYSDYVQSAAHLSGVFEEHLRTLQQTALRNLRMVITTGISSRILRATWVAPGIKPLPIPSEAPTGGQPIELELGRVSTDRDYRLLLELVVAARSAGPTEIGEVTFTYDAPSLGREHESVQYQLTTTFVERQDSDPPVDLRVHDALRKITAHRLQEQAMQAIQEGQTQKGTASLRMAATHLEAAGCTELADLAKAEAARVERQGQAQAGNMKRIIYGTRKLG